MGSQCGANDDDLNENSYESDFKKKLDISLALRNSTHTHQIRLKI